MPDREKVIKGLEQFRADLKPFCGNRADWERFDAALIVLKEQEADTSKQYRDGWDDAMDYIFMNGKGYQPYIRKEGR